MPVKEGRVTDKRPAVSTQVIETQESEARIQNPEEKQWPPYSGGQISS
jgi:hypothetical protein